MDARARMKRRILSRLETFTIAQGCTYLDESLVHMYRFAAVELSVYVRKTRNREVRFREQPNPTGTRSLFVTGVYRTHVIREAAQPDV